MYTILFSTIAGSLWGAFTMSRSNFFDEDDWASRSLIFAVLGAVVGVGLAFVIGAFPATTENGSGYAELAALQDGSRISGHFFLGSGNVNQQSYYFFYRKIGEGRYVMDQIDAEKAIIVEDEPSHPYLISYSSKFVDPRMVPVGIALVVSPFRVSRTEGKHSSELPPRPPMNQSPTAIKEMPAGPDLDLLVATAFQIPGVVLIRDPRRTRPLVRWKSRSEPFQPSSDIAAVQEVLKLFRVLPWQGRQKFIRTLRSLMSENSSIEFPLRDLLLFVTPLDICRAALLYDHDLQRTTE